MKIKTLAKRCLSFVLVMSMLLTTFFFANIFTVSEAAATGPFAYGMSAPEQVSALATYISDVGEDWVKIFYPTDIYMDVTENLQDLGYVFRTDGHYGDSTDFRYVICGDVYGGTNAKPSAPMNTMPTVFNDYGVVGSLDGIPTTDTTIVNEGLSQDNWAKNGVDQDCWTMKYTDKARVNFFMKGTPNQTGNFEYSSKGSDIVLVFQHWEKEWYEVGKKWKTKAETSVFTTGDVEMKVHIYDKAPLQTAVINAPSYNGASNYPEFQLILNDAKAMLKNREVTQEQVTAMTQKLTSFRFKGDYRAVDEAMVLYNNLNEADYTKESFAEVKKAVDYVVYDLYSEDQATIYSFATSIKNAINNLVRVADYKSVYAAVARYEALNLDHYVDISKAKAIYDSIDYTLTSKDQDTVSGYAIRLNMAIDELVLKDADYEEYNATVERANALVKTDYTDFSAVEAALAVDVSGKDITGQSEIDAATQAIKDAIDQLEMILADYSALKVQISKFRRMNAALYTKASYALPLSIADNANMNLPVSKQDEVNQITQDLKEAVAKMEKLASFTKIKTAISSYEALDLTIYTEDSVAAAKAIYDEIKASVTYDEGVSKQTQLDNYAASLTTAIGNLQIKKSGVAVDGYVGNLSSPTVETTIAPLKDVTITLKSGEETIKTTVTDVNGYFNLTEISTGDYTLTLSGKSIITRTINITVADVNLSVSTQEKAIGLIACDYDDNGFISASDYTLFVAAIGLTSADQGYNKMYDFDSNGVVNSADYIAFVNFFGASASTYLPWVM